MFASPAADVQAALWAKPGLLALHLVHFRVPIGRENAGKVQPLRDLGLRLRLPDGFRVAAVRAWSPERTEARELKFEQAGSELRFHLPELRIYEV